MPTIGPTELILLLAITLIIIGPGKIPELGKALGGSLREFKRAKFDGDEMAGESAADARVDESSASLKKATG